MKREAFVMPRDFSGPVSACATAFCWLVFAGQASGADVDLVRVDKSERQMQLVSEGLVLRTYAIALGANPLGHKRQEGDERTSEGRYSLDWRNPQSAFTKSIHIS